MPRKRLVFASLVIAVPTAHATHGYVETEEDKLADVAVLEADRAPQWDSNLGFAVGTFHTGPVYNLAYGLDLQGGFRLGHLGLYGTYTLLGLAAPTTYASDGSAALSDGSGAPSADHTPTGMAQRFGLSARYSLGRFSSATGGIAVTGDVWVEAGLGEQLIRWNAGGELHRMDVSLGFGTSFGARGLHHHGAYYFALRATIARSPRSYDSDVSTCAGPCDTATPPLDLDKSIVFTTGVVFGS